MPYHAVVHQALRVIHLLLGMGAREVAGVERDRNLLFGIFAAQLKGVRPQQLVDAGAAWATDPSRSLSSRLVEAGIITEADEVFLNHLVDEAVKVHGGDTTLALHTLGGEARVEDTFLGSLVLTVDGGVQTVEMRRDISQPLGMLLNLPEEAPGRYSRITVYGTGGMGRILLVHDEHMDRDVAMKELLPLKNGEAADAWTPVGQTAAMVARFLREARLTGLLEHPGIVPVYELGQCADGSLYYTMKLVRGKTMLQGIREGSTLDARLALLPHFLNLCQAIAYAHSRGVIHRDIKPANVMIGDFGETVVLDWGIAKSQGSQDLHEEQIAEALTTLKLNEKEPIVQTEVGETLGTPHYMPPEQAEGRVQDIDKRSDVYSLGAVLYELLTGRTPCAGRTTREILANVVRSEITPVRALTPEVPADLAAIAGRCLAKGPAERYDSAKELAAEMERFLSGALVQSFHYSLPQVLLHYYRLHRGVVHTALAGAAAVLLLAVYSYMSISRAYVREQAQRELAETARGAAERARDEAVVARDEEEAARAEAEKQQYFAQTRLADALVREGAFIRAEDALWKTPYGERNWEWGYLLNLCHQDVHTLSPQRGAVLQAAFCGDGSRLLTAEAFALQVWSTATGEQLLEYRFEPLRVDCAAWSSAPDAIAVSLNDGSIRLLGSAVKSSTLVEGTGGRLQHMEFSPSGTMLAAAEQSGNVAVYDAIQHQLLERGEVDKAGLWRVHFVDENQVLFQTKNDTIFSYRTRPLEKLYALGGSNMRLLREQRLLFTATNNTVSIFDVTDGSLLKQSPALPLPITSLEVSHDGARLLALTSDEARVFDAASFAFIALAGPPAMRPQFTADGGAVAGFDLENKVRVWNVSSGEVIREFAGHSAHILDMRLHPHQSFAVTVGMDEQAKLWDLRANPGREHIWPDIQPDGQMQLAQGGKDFFLDQTGLLHVVTQEGERLALGGFPNDVPPFAVDTAGDRVVIAVDAFVPVVYSLEQDTVLADFRQHHGLIGDLDICRDGRLVASVDFTNCVKVWDAGTGQELQQLPVISHDVRRLGFNTDGTMLAAGGEAPWISIWDPQSGQLLQQISLDELPLSDAWWLDAHRLAVVLKSGVVQVYDTGKRLFERDVLRLSQEVSQVRLTADGARMLGLGGTENASIFDCASGTALLSLTPDAHARQVGLELCAEGDSAVIADMEQGLWKLSAAERALPALVRSSAESQRAYFLAHRAPATPVPSMTPVRVVFFTAQEDLESLVSIVKAVFRGKESGEPAEGICIDDSMEAGPLALMGLHPGDTVTHWNGEAVRTAGDLRAAMTPPHATFPQVVAVLRRGVSYEIHYRTLPITSVTHSVQLTTEEAAALQGLLSRYLTRGRESLRGLNDMLQRKVGTARGTTGIWLSALQAVEERKAYHMLGLSGCDCITAINGTPMRLDELEKLLKDWPGEGFRGSFTLSVRRGSFLQREIKVEVL